VAELKPALRTVVQTYRQHYRGRMWHVLRDPTNNQFFRLDDAGFQFVGMLDGKRNVAQVWDACCEQLGDRAPTQGEAIQLLGQLFTSNLLSAELPPDAAGMFERYRKRVRREISGYLMNLLFIRLPLFDPEPILEKWVGAVGWVFGKVGFILWAILLAVGFSHLSGHWEELLKAADPQLMLQKENVALLYLCFAGIKAIHEFGHGFACKTYGKRTGTGGEVHTMGIMFLVLMPVPYVDASSAWAFRNKWHRVMVGAAGMYVELAVAAVAAIVWANTQQGTLVHDICYNLIFVAGVSTVLFNANPLLRYDGYYILSDMLEMPNLAQRGKDYLYYLVKRYVYRVRKPRNPAHTPGERFWLLTYAVASGIYRVFVSVAIMLYLMGVLQDYLFFLGLILGVSGLVGWIVVPLFKWVKYLFTSEELMRTRPLAMWTTGLFMALVVTLVGIIPYPDRHRGEGVIEPREYMEIYARTDGVVLSVATPGTQVTPQGPTLFVLENRELVAKLAMLEAERREIEAQTRQARADNEIGLAQSLLEKMTAVEAQDKRLREELKSLRQNSPITGQWISPDIEQATGTFIKRGDKIGKVASTDVFVLRVVVDQTLGGRITRDVLLAALEQGREARVEVRVKGRPREWFYGVIRSREDILPAGTNDLPSAALGYLAGGTTQVKMDDQHGTKTAEPVFEVRIHPLHEERNAELLADWETRAKEARDLGKPEPAKPERIELKSGQRIVVRFEMPARPLAAQWWLELRQMLQQRFKM
jgi:putative peptide zinc metalloprotease protein